jgi:uncharacterized membrane protein YjdF
MAFYILLIIYSIIELLILRIFIMKKEKVAIKSTAISFVFLWLVLIATFIFDFQIPHIAFTFVILSFLIHSYLGYHLNLYNKSKNFDRIAHGIGSFSLAIFTYYFLANFLRYGGSKAFQAVYILLLGISLGAVYEIIEFVIDLNNPKKLQRGLRDTNFDIFSDIVGSTGAAILAFLILL